MKKLLILILIFVVNSLANGTVSLSASNIFVMPGNTITISVSSDNTQGYVKYLDIEKSFIDLYTSEKGYVTLGAVSIKQAAGAQASVIDYSTDSLYDLCLTAADWTFTPTPGVHFTVPLTFTGLPESGSITLYLLRDGDFAVEDSITFYTLPEPATMVLLCFGGFLLRKRK